jgi:hypothetical protein
MLLGPSARTIKKTGRLFLFTDGEELEGDTLLVAGEQCVTMRIFTAGVGSKEGSLIPIR